jgi:hypothetical protein
VDEGFDHPAGHGRVQDGVARGKGPDRSDELIGGGVLEQEPGGAGAERFVDVFVKVECAEGEHPGRLRFGHQPSGRGETVQDGHPKATRTTSGLVGRNQGYGGPAVRCLADDLDVRLVGQQRAESGPNP